MRDDGTFARIFSVARKIPPGRVCSYGVLARLAGLPRGAQVAGWAMMQSPPDVPAHRVVHADGALCVGHEWQEIQRQMLLAEGVTFLPDGRADMAAHLWDGEAQS
jgi:methylated-DNA-protein-cysteine methyltransferase-like protein